MDTNLPKVLQNSVQYQELEGLADGMTSTEMQLNLLNVARSSLKELKADYEDYLQKRHLEVQLMQARRKGGM